VLIINKHRSKLKNWSVEMPNAPYSNRCVKFKDSMTDTNLRPNQRIRQIVGISTMLVIGAMHGFRIGQYLNGRLYIYYYSFASDLVLPIGSYFMLSMVEIQFRFLHKWFVKALIVFVVMTFSEIMQIFGFYFFGVTFYILDILMFGMGVLIAVLIDKQIFNRFLPYWEYASDNK
jgi:hypothetical protein